MISGFRGSGPVRYSPDGAWLLVGSSLAIRLADLGVLDLPAAQSSAWAPSLGPSKLLQIRGREEDGFRLATFDLATGAEQDLGPLEIEPDALVLYLTELDVHPSEGRALCVTPRVPRPYRDGQGARGKLQILDLETRRLTPVTSPTLPGFDHIERAQDRPRWIVDRRGASVQLADQLEAQLRPPVRLEAGPAGTVGDMAMMLLQRCLTDLEPDRPTRNPGRVRVELLRAMRSLQEVDRAKADQFLPQVRMFTFPLAMEAMGRIDPVNGIDWSGRPMVWLDGGLQGLEEGRFHEYSWVENAYFPGETFHASIDSARLNGAARPSAR